MKRRNFLQTLGAAGLAVPAVSSLAHTGQPTTGRLRHASLGVAGMAGYDIENICSSPDVDLVAVAEIDLNRVGPVIQAHPGVRIYQDWRELLEKEQDHIDSVSVSTPDHVHAMMAMAAMQRGKHVYCQKPLAHDLHEVRRLTEMARTTGVVTQMGIQIHSERPYRQAVELVQSGVIGGVREVHLWSNKKWGDAGPPPVRETPDVVPEGFNWDQWLGGCAERPFIGDRYYHPGQWRRRLDFGTGTFGDMGCHIFDPVFEALALTAPLTVRSEGPPPDAWNWAINAEIHYLFPGTRFTAGDTVKFSWYDGDRLPPAEIRALVEDPAGPTWEELTDKAAATPAERALARRRSEGFPEQGSIVVGTEGTMLIPHIAEPRLYPFSKYENFVMPKPASAHHWHQWVDACLGRGETSTPFDYSGPLTEAVLLGSVAVRFPGEELTWDAAGLRFPDHPEANTHVRRPYREGWQEFGL